MRPRGDEAKEASVQARLVGLLGQITNDNIIARISLSLSKREGAGLTSRKSAPPLPALVTPAQD